MTEPTLVIPREFVSGRMKFKVRSVNKCGTKSDYSRVLTLTITGNGLENEGDKCKKVKEKEEKKVDDYELRVANAMQDFWKKLLEEQKVTAKEAIKKAFPKNGRETDVFKA